LTLGYDESDLGFSSLVCGSSSLKWKSQYLKFLDLFLFPMWEMGWVIKVIVGDVPVGSWQSHVAFGWIRRKRAVKYAVEKLHKLQCSTGVGIVVVE